MSPAAAGRREPRKFHKVVRRLPDEFDGRFELSKPMPVEFEEVGPSAVVACFREAELSVTGYDVGDAETDLASRIVDMYEDLRVADPAALGKTLAKRKRVLQEHLRRRE